MRVKINVIAKINCYFDRSLVTLKLHKEYLNTVTHNCKLQLYAVMVVSTAIYACETWRSTLKEGTKETGHVPSAESTKDD